MALLGRISAVLTANTQDFTRPLATATADLRRFAQQARGLSFNLDDRALSRTLTRVQEFQRRVEEIRRAQAASVGLGLPNPDRLLDKFRAFEDVGRPLTEVKNKVEQLSTAVQAELIPALSSLQADWQTLYRQIDTGGTTFDAATGRINRLRDGVIAFGRAVAAAQDLGKLASGLNANNTGASFFQPGAKESLQRTQELRNNAEKVPARFRGGVFADLSVEAERNAEEIERAAARVAAAQLRIARDGPNPDRITRRGIAQAELDTLTNRQGVINDSFSRELNAAQIRQIVSPQAARQVDTLIERFGAAADALRQLGGANFSGLIRGVGQVVDQLNQGTVAARSAREAIEAMEAAASSVGRVRSMRGDSDSLLYSANDFERRRIQSDFDRSVNALDPNDPARTGAAYRRDISLRRLSLNEEAIPRTNALAEQARGFNNANLTREANSLLTINREISAELRRQEQAVDGKNYRQAEASEARILQLMRDQEDTERRITAEVRARGAAGVQAERVSGLRGSTNDLLTTDRQRQLAQIREEYRNSVSGLAANDPMRQDAENRRNIATQRVELNNDIIPRTTALAENARSFWDPQLTQDADRLLRINQQISNELRIQENATDNGNYRLAEQSAQRLNQLLQQQQDLEGRVTREVETQAAARRQNEMFMRAAGRSSEPLSQGARDAASDVSVANQFRGQIANGGSRIAIDNEITRTTTAVTRLQQQMAQVPNLPLTSAQQVAELDRLDNEIRQTTQGLAGFIAAQSAGAFSTSQISTAMERARNTAGSITTRGAGAVQLAAQQALFAIDDLISATGGLEYKLRAVGNNITQLGLLLGQSGVIPGLSATTGLMVGLGVVIGGQVVSALLRYVTAAQQAEDISKALGASVEKQASLFNQVQQGITSIGESLTSKGFSEAAKGANELAEALQKILKQQEELKKESLIATDLGAIERRGERVRLDAAAGANSNPGTAIAIERSRRRLERQDIATGNRIAAEGPLSGVGVRNLLRDSSARLAAANARISGGMRGTADAIASGSGDAAELFGFSTRGNAALLSAAQRIGVDAEAIPTGSSQSDRRAQAQALNDSIERLRDISRQRVFGFETTASAGASEEIRRLQREQILLIADSGLPEYFKSISSASKRLADAQGLLTAAVEAGIPGAGAASEGVSALSKQLQDSIARLGDAREALQKGDSSVTPDAVDAAKKEVDAISATIAAREREALAIRNLLDSIDKERAAVESASGRIAESFGAIRQESDSTVGEARSRVRELATEGVNGPVSQGRLDRARGQLDDQRRFRDELAASIASAQDAARRNPAVVAAEQRISEIDGLLKSEGVLRDNGQRDALARERAALQIQRDEAVVSLTEGDRGVSAARGRQDEAARLAKSIEEGVVLSMGSTKKAGLELSQSLRDIDAARVSGAVPAAESAKASSRLVDDAMRQAAPAIFGMADQVMNAVVQGPSRAALQANDINTSQGASELGRLLRGDDSAKDQNLVELQKQSTALEELVTIARENGAPPGVID